jgi:hypothetical protein
MESAPKIVVDRLRVALPVVNHPDADVLTAFSEQSLPERERAIVMEHLARCGDCREIVALALPAVEEATQVVQPTPTGWLTWPALRWGIIAAGIVAIASFGVVQYQRNTRPAMMAQAQPESGVKEANNQVASTAEAAKSAKQDEVSLPSTNLAIDADRKSKPVTLMPKELDGLAKVPRSGGQQFHGSIGGPMPHGPKAQWQQNFQSNNVQDNKAFPSAQAPPPAYSKQPPNAFMGTDSNPPAPSETVMVQGQAVTIQSQGQTEEVSNLQAQAAPLQSAESGQERVERAKDLETAAAGQANSAAQQAANLPVNGRNFSQLVEVAPVGMSWKINSTGGLQRSLDQGKTWQAVDVNNSSAGISAVMLQSARAVTAESKKASASKQAAVPIAFRAVTAIETHVWAGGANGVLYHSSDSGSHWTRVMPSSAGVPLISDIVTLDFPDLKHGRITTSTGEVWLTSDAGQTWQKQ